MSRESEKADILAIVSGIPSGQVMSYGEVARRAGLPGRARWVGRVLREADVGGLPWHRVLRADGRTGLATGSAAWETQHARLEIEGVRFSNGRVLPEYFARAVPDLDAAVWGSLSAIDKS